MFFVGHIKPNVQSPKAGSPLDGSEGEWQSVAAFLGEQEWTVP